MFTKIIWFGKKIKSKLRKSEEKTFIILEQNYVTLGGEISWSNENIEYFYVDASKYIKNHSQINLAAQ